MLPEIIDGLSASVQPLVFETDLPEFPYSTRGTVFIVGYERRTFVLTTRHGLYPENGPPICVFPSDTSQRIIPLKDVFFVLEDHVSDDFVDFAAVEIDMNEITNKEVGSASLIDVALASGDWLSNSETAETFVLGYPEEHQFVDYELETITNQRWALQGRYAGASDMDHRHILEISGKHNLSTFSGFSGGPVFAWVELPGNRGQIILCGMALRGTPASWAHSFSGQICLAGCAESQTYARLKGRNAQPHNCIRREGSGGFCLFGVRCFRGFLVGFLPFTLHIVNVIFPIVGGC